MDGKFIGCCYYEQSMHGEWVRVLTPEEREEMAQMADKPQPELVLDDFYIPPPTQQQLCDIALRRMWESAKYNRKNPRHNAEWRFNKTIQELSIDEIYELARHMGGWPTTGEVKY